MAGDISHVDTMQASVPVLYFRPRVDYDLGNMLCCIMFMDSEM